MEQLDKLRNDLGRVLQIAIHHHSRIAGDVVESGRQRRLMSEIPRKRDNNDPRIFVRGLFQQFERAVSAAIIHEYNFMRAAGKLIKHIEYPAHQFRNNRFFVENWNRNGKAERAGHTDRIPFLLLSSYKSCVTKARARTPNTTSGDDSVLAMTLKCTR